MRPEWKRMRMRMRTRIYCSPLGNHLDKNRAHFSIMHRLKKMVIDQRMDQQMDGQTDTLSYRDAWTHLKTTNTMHIKYVSMKICSKARYGVKSP